MSQRMGLTEFFAMEASEYLDRLDTVVSSPTPPDAGEFLRLTRALRGSALMARQDTIAAAAAAFESFARSVHTGGRWDEATRQRAIRAVDDFKVLVRQVGRWTDAETTRAQNLVADLAPETAGAAEIAQPGGADGLDAGARAFVGREGAAVANALDQAAKGLQQDPRAHQAVRRVLSVAQPLRGLSSLPDIPPLGDLLEAVERAAAEIVSSAEPLHDAPMLLDAAAKAVARTAQELARDGFADSEAAEVRRFATLLGQLGEGAVVPIESLYHDDDGPHIVERGKAPARTRILGHVELVSHGEHLVQAAHEVARAASNTQVALRLQSLLATFRTLAEAGGNPVLDAVSAFAVQARNAALSGAVTENTAAFVGRLKDAGHALVEAATGDESRLANALREAADAVRRLRAQSTAARPAAVSAPAAVAPAARPTPGPKPAAPSVAGPGLAASWARYEQLRSKDAPTPGFDAFLTPSSGHTAAAPPPAAEPELPSILEFVEDAAAAPAPEEQEEALVSITDLCFSGQAALDRAVDLRRAIADELAAGAVSDTLRDLIEEVLDLVELSRND